MQEGWSLVSEGWGHWLNQKQEVIQCRQEASTEKPLKGREGSWEACVEQVTAGFSNHKERQRGWVRRGELKRTEL